MQQPQFFIGQDVIFSSDGYSAVVRVLGARWDTDANDWQYRYQADAEHDGWFYQADATHFVRLTKDWESIESQSKSTNVYEITS